MKHSTGKPTKAEAERMARLKEMRCVACELHKAVLRWGRPAEVHHLLSGNKRRGHLFTIPLCPWHHRGDCGALPVRSMERLYGPSLARTSKKFRATYGSDEVLLRATNEFLGEL